MVSPRKSSESISPSQNNPDESHAGERSDDLLIIGDDAIGKSTISHLVNSDDVVFVSVADSDFEDTEAQRQPMLKIDRVPELFCEDIEVAPSTAIVATSHDGRNLLLTVHLQQKYDLEAIVVRVNEPQHVELFADRSVEIADVTDVVGAELAEKLGQSSDPQ